MAVDVLSLKYGAITRSDPLRLVDPAHLLCMHCDAPPPPQENASVKLSLVGSWLSAATVHQVARRSH